MRYAKTVLVAAVAATLLHSGDVRGSFTGIVTEEDDFGLDGVTLLSVLGMPGDLRVINVYAQFDDPSDQCLGVVGTPDDPFLVYTDTGDDFVNSGFGGDPPPLTGLIGVFPELNWDSFYTIGLFSVNPPIDALLVAPSTPGPNTQPWPAAPPGTNMGWVVPPDDTSPQTLLDVVLNWGCTGTCTGDSDGNGVVDMRDVVRVLETWSGEGTPTYQSVAENSTAERVLLMRLVVPTGSEITGTFGLVYKDSGGTSTISTGFATDGSAPITNITQGIDYFAFIQDAIDEASPFDEIVVRPRTYDENITLTTTPVTLRSENPDDEAVVAATVIRGLPAGDSVVTCIGCSADNVLAGFTITGGDASWGGGMYNDGGSPTVTNCTFSGNSANVHGGGMCNFQSSPTVINCAFRGNAATDEIGGGMFNALSANPTVTNCTFTGNTAGHGGGMGNDAGSSPAVTNCAFSGNAATDEIGGGMYNAGTSPTVTNCTFSGNSANVHGGGMGNGANANPTVTNCTFAGNWADVSGGGMYNSSFNSNPTVTNCTFAGNAGAGVYNGDNSTSVTNCIFWDNSQSIAGTSDPIVTYSDVQGGFPGTGNIDSDPLFHGGPTGAWTADASPYDATTGQTTLYDDNAVWTVDALAGNFLNPDTQQVLQFSIVSNTATTITVWGDVSSLGLTGTTYRVTDYRLGSNSPCIDAGDNDAVPVGVVTDLDGQGRFVDDFWVEDTGALPGDAPYVDMGCYERQEDSAPLLVTVPSVEAATIAEAIDIVGEGAEIIVDPGYYPETIDLGGKSLWIHAVDPTNPRATVIDGGQTGSVIRITGGQGPETIVEGFTITGGTGNDDEFPGFLYGGGIYIGDGTAPTIRHCILAGNSADVGAGLFGGDGGIDIADCTFTENLATLGGGMWSRGPVTMTRCIFSGNTALDNGGGLVQNEGSITASNCLFNGNMAIGVVTPGAGFGGGLSCATPGTVTNCTFVGNFAAVDGGAMFLDGADLTVENCLLWGNHALGGNEIFTTNCAGSCATFSYCDVEESGGSAGWSIPDVADGGGNIDADPLLPDALERTRTALADYDAVTAETTFEGISPPMEPGLDLVGRFIQPMVGDHLQAVIVSNTETQIKVAGDFSSIVGPPITCRILDHRPALGSPCVDAGDNGAVVDATDLVFTVRILDGTLDGVAAADMGAYELDASVNALVANHTRGTFHTSIDAAIGLSQPGDVLGANLLAFADAPQIDFLGTGLTLRSTGAIDQAAGGQYVLADEGALEAAAGADVTLEGALLAPILADAEVRGDAFTILPVGELTAESGSALFIDAPAGAALYGRALLNGGSFVAFTGDTILGGAGMAFADQEVSSSAAQPNDAVAADLDGDGDLDVLAALSTSIAWYESDGGDPPAFTTHAVTGAVVSGRSVDAADVDGDGHVDLLSASSGNDTIAWYESDGSQPPTFTQHVISSTADETYDVHAVDLDGDGHVDVLAASEGDDTIAWYESDGGDPPAFTPHVVSALVDGAPSVHAADVDGDGDLDVLSAARIGNEIAWHESDGLEPPSFVATHTIASAPGAQCVHPADVDGDGDVDVLAASAFAPHRVAWHENDGADPLPAFTEHVLVDGATNAWSVWPDDVDGDGDMDILSAWLGADTVAWHESDGAVPPGFTTHVIAGPAIVDGPRSVFGADLDGDGDADVLAASSIDNTVAWHENLGGATRLSAGSSLAVGGTLDSERLLAVLGGTVLTDGVLTNTGRLRFHGGLVEAGGGMSNPGVLEGYGDLYGGLANLGQMICVSDTHLVGDCDNTGTITVQDGTLTILGTLSGDGDIIGDFFTATESPAGDSAGDSAGDGLFIEADLSLGPAASLMMASEGASLRVGGSFDVAIDDHARLHLALAEVRMVGLAPQTLEVMSTDVGPDPAGLDRTLPGHFPIGTLRIGPTPTTVTFVDAHDNDGLGAGEALYVQTLRVDAGASLVTAGRRVYYVNEQITGTVDDPANVAPIEFVPPCPEDLNDNGQVDFADILAVIAAWGPCGAPCPEDLNGNGQVDFADILGVIGAWGACP